MDATAGSLITTLDYVWARLTGRLTGLTDQEYFWEPVAGCWSLRQDDEGRWQLDGGGGGGPAPDPVAVTTIAWRIGHMAGYELLSMRGSPDLRTSMAEVGLNLCYQGVHRTLERRNAAIAAP